MKTTLSILLHGSSGVGKSWLADTVPGPRLILDAEGRARYTPSGPKRMWNPRSEEPPVADGTWDTCVVSVTDFETLNMAYQWLRAGTHPFVSVVLDSVMEAQKRCIDSIVGVSQLDQQDWGTLLRKMEALVRSYRDLALIPTNPVHVVAFVCGTRADKNGKMEPLLQGQFADTVPYYVDVVGYYHKQTDAAGAMYRALLVDELPGFVAKDGTGRLIATYGSIVPNPNISTMFGLLQNSGIPELVAPAEVAVAPEAAVAAEGGTV